jgi:DNA end-binding protein Ku
VYSLLREALVKSKRVGIATFVLRTKEYLAALRPCGNALVLDTMHFADEIREAEGIPEGKTEIKEDELKLTQQLIESMEQSSFDASKFPDTYSKAVQEMIERKLEGKKVEGGKAAPRHATNVLDLMSRLKASLEETEGKEKKPAKKKAAAKKSTTKKSTTKEKAALKKAA